MFKLSLITLIVLSACTFVIVDTDDPEKEKIIKKK